MYACAELFCVLTNVSNKFVFRRFPQRSRPLSLLPLAWAPGRRFYVWATRETYQDRRWFNSRTKNKLETRRNAQMKGSDSIIRFSTWFLHEKQHTCPIPAALSRSLRFHCKVVSLLTFSVHRTQVKNARRKIPSLWPKSCELLNFSRLHVVMKSYLKGLKPSKQKIIGWVAKEVSQPEHYTEFGAGSGDQADQVAGGFPNLPQPTFFYFRCFFVFLCVWYFLMLFL